MQPRQAKTPPHRSECVAQSEEFDKNSNWSWQLPPTNVSTPLQFRKLNSETSVRVPPLPTTGANVPKEGTFPVPSVLVSDSRVESTVARVGPVAKMTFA